MKREFLLIRNITQTYNLGGGTGEVIALNNLSLSINEGDFVTIVGSNAAGKTTLFNLITGSLLPTSGDIVLEGKSILSIPEFQRARFISCVRQNPNESIINSMTLAENLALAKLRTKNAGLSRGVKQEWKQQFIGVLKPFGLGLEKRLDDKIDALSGGQKQTVALLMATLVTPKLLLLDEHVASLDPNVSESVLSITDQIVRDKRVTTLMITHNIHHAIKYGNRLILLDKGVISFQANGPQKKSLNIIDIIQRLEGGMTEFEEDVTKSD